MPAAAQDGLGTETGAELGGGVVLCSALPCVGFTGHLDTLQELGPILPSSLSSRVFSTFRVFHSFRWSFSWQLLCLFAGKAPISCVSPSSCADFKSTSFSCFLDTHWPRLCRADPG